MNNNPNLISALEMMRDKFPNAACFAEENAGLYSHGGTHHHFRLCVVRNGVCDAGKGETVEAAFERLVNSTNEDKSSELEAAKLFLESRGFQVAKI
jgi:hypothetical protein